MNVLLPAWVKDANPVVRARAQLFVAVIAISIFAACASTAFHIYHGATLRGLFSLASIIPGLGSLILFHWTRNFQLAVHFLLGVLLSGIVVSPYLSSIHTTVPVGVAMVPFLAAAMAGLTAGVVWTVTTLAVLTVTAFLVLNEPVALHTAINTWLVAGTCGFGSCLLEFARISAVEAADKASVLARSQTQERARTQEALDTSQALLAHSFREAPSLLILSELETGHIVDVNKSFERISGWTLEEVRGRTLTELNAWVEEGDRQRLAEIMTSSGRIQNAEMQLRKKTGEVIWMLAAGSILQIGGSGHILSQGIDVTDRKKAEQELAKYRTLLETKVDQSSIQLRESQAALRQQQQLAAIGTLAAGIAHQINNPIGSIMASAEFALLAGQDDDRDMVQQEALRNVVSEAERCGMIVRNVLRFARQEPTARWTEDLNPLVRRATELTTPYVIESGGRVELNLAPDVCEARVSPIEIEQVLVNVIRNATEALESEGEVRISTRRREALIEIEVEDNGRGMDSELLAHVFDPFYTTRINQGGTGLGLSFAHGVIADHGGEIVVDSNPSKGTRVRIRLPGVVGGNT